MTSGCLWKNFAVYVLVTSQVVLSGVLHSNEEISKSDQQFMTEDKLNGNNGIYKYKIDDQKYMEQNGKTIKYGEVINKEYETPLSNEKNISTEINNDSILQESVTKGSVDDNQLNYESKTLHHGGKVLESGVLNSIETKINSDDEGVKDKKTYGRLNSSDDNVNQNKFHIIQSEKENHNDNSIAKEGDIGKINYNVYDLHKENELETKKHNKRELNYPYNFRNDDYYRRPEHNFENTYNRFNRNPNYNDEKYYRYNDYHTDTDNFHHFKHRKFNEDDDNTDDDDVDDDDYSIDSDNYNTESDINEENDGVLKEREGDKLNESDVLSEEKIDLPSDFDPDDETLQLFTYLLESIITQKLKELEKNEDKPYLKYKPHIMKINKTKEALLNKQKNDTLPKNKTNSNIKQDFEDELHSSPVKEEWRNTRNIKDSIVSLFFNQDDDNTWDDENNKNLIGLEKQFKERAVYERPFIFIKSDEELNEDPQDNNDKKLDNLINDLKYDDSSDSKKDDMKTTKNDNKLDSFEDEESLGDKNIFRRNTDSVLRPHYPVFNDHEIEINRQFDYPFCPIVDNALRMNINRYPWINCNEGPYIKELPVRRPPFPVLNSHSSDVSSVFDLHDQFDNFNEVEDKSMYNPDRVRLYSLENNNQNIPNGNTNTQYINQLEESHQSGTTKIKRDLRNQLENSEKTENNNDNIEFIESSVHTIENLIAKYLLDNIKDLPEKLTEDEKEVITKNILNDITNKISQEDIMDYIFKRRDIMNYYQQVDPLFDTKGNLLSHESKIRREIDGNNNYYKECVKPCINIKSLNIFYEFSGEGKNCIHIPKDIESKPSLNSLKYQKRHSTPYEHNGSLQKKDKTITGMTPKHNPNSPLSDTEEVSSKESSENEKAIPTSGFSDNISNDTPHQTVSDLKANESGQRKATNDMKNQSDQGVKSISKVEKPYSDAKSIAEETRRAPLKKISSLNDKVNLANETPKNKKLNNSASTMPLNLSDETYHETQSEQENINKDIKSIPKNSNKSNMSQNGSSVNRTKVNSSDSSINPSLPSSHQQIERTDKIEQGYDSDNEDISIESGCMEGEVCYRNIPSENNKERENKQATNAAGNKEQLKNQCIERKNENRNKLSGGENEIKHQKCQNRTGEKKINLNSEDPQSDQNRLLMQDNSLNNSERQLMSDSQIRDDNDNTVKPAFNQINPTNQFTNKNNEISNTRKASRNPSRGISNNNNKTTATEGNSENRKLKHSESKWIPEEGDMKEQGKRHTQEGDNDEEITEEKLKMKKDGKKKVISNSKKDYYMKNKGIINDKESIQKKPVKAIKATDFEIEHDQYVDEDYSDDGNENYENDVLNINVERRGMNNNDVDEDDSDKKSLSHKAKAMEQNEDDLTDSVNNDEYADDQHEVHGNDNEYEDSKEVEDDEQYHDDVESDFEQNNTEVQNETDEKYLQHEIRRETQNVKPIKSEKKENNLKNENENEYDQIEEEDKENDELDDQDSEEYEDTEKDFHQQKRGVSSGAMEKVNGEDEDVDYTQEEDEYTEDVPSDEYVSDYIQDKAKKSSNQVSNHVLTENTKRLESNKNNDYAPDEYEENEDEEEEYQEEKDVDKNNQIRRIQEIEIIPKVFEKNFDKKTHDVLNNRQEDSYEDEEDEKASDSDGIFVDVTNDVENKFSKYNSRSQVKEEIIDQNEDEYKEDKFSKELNNSQITQKRRTKSTLKEDERNNESFTDEEKINPEKTYHRAHNISPSQKGHRDNESDYVRKSDVEKIIKEILDSNTNSKQKEEMFYNGPQSKYRELVKDIATYFAKKNLTAGDDIYIYEEYGSKHGDNNAIYLSGTKMYQNGVPKKDAENFNIIINKPHHKTEDVSKKSTEMLDSDENTKNIEEDYTESYKPFTVKEYVKHHKKRSKSKRHYEQNKTLVGNENSKIKNKEQQKNTFSKTG